MNGETAPPERIPPLSDGMRADLHWHPEDTSPERLAETLAGMANSGGGRVLLGIAPRSGNIQGVQDLEAAHDRFLQAALLAEPPLILPLPIVVQAEGKQIISISVPADLPHVYSLQGRFLGREGRHTVPLTASELRKLLQARGRFHFESQVPPGATVEDLDEGQARAYLRSLTMPGSTPLEPFLRQRGCLREANGSLRPTYAGLLLFGRHPQQWVPSATILAARFHGTELSDEFIKLEARGTLPDQIRTAEGFAREHLHRRARLTGLTREETTEYPMEAVRELIVNAVAHRDYNIQGDEIHLNIFSDHLEVRSPGELPGPVNLDNLLAARFSRNPVIVQALSDLGFVERFGYGLNRVVSAMREHGLRPPQFDEMGGTFQVTLHGPGPETYAVPDPDALRDLDLNPRQIQALQYLTTHPRITNRAYQELCPDVHPETLRRDLADLVARDLLLKIGQKRATYYILKSSSRQGSSA